MATFFSIPSYIAQFFFAIACFNIPKAFKKAWEASNVHVSQWIFYPIVLLSALSALYLAYNMFSMLGLQVALIGVALIAAIYIYCVVLDKANRIHVEYIDEMRKELSGE